MPTHARRPSANRRRAKRPRITASPSSQSNSSLRPPRCCRPTRHSKRPPPLRPSSLSHQKSSARGADIISQPSPRCSALNAAPTSVRPVPYLTYSYLTPLLPNLTLTSSCLAAPASARPSTLPPSCLPPPCLPLSHALLSSAQATRRCRPTVATPAATRPSSRAFPQSRRLSSPNSPPPHHHDSS